MVNLHLGVENQCMGTCMCELYTVYKEDLQKPKFLLHIGSCLEDKNF